MEEQGRLRRDVATRLARGVYRSVWGGRCGGSGRIPRVMRFGTLRVAGGLVLIGCPNRYSAQLEGHGTVIG